MTVIATGITVCLDNTDNENGDGESNDGSMNTNTEGQNTISYEQCGKRIIPIGELPSLQKMKQWSLLRKENMRAMIL